MKKFSLWPFIFLLLTWFPAYAQGQEKQLYFSKTVQLTADEIVRLKVCKRLSAGIDKKSFEESLAALERYPYPEENLQILEAMTRTYVEIIQQGNVVEQKTKEWLYSMIALNMAYLQLGGIQVKQDEDTPLNKLIRQKLKEHLPVILQENQEIFKPLE